jgi:excinuclease ABC subunit A
MDKHNFIRIEGAHQNNLKNISLDIPLNKMIVITGVSGSGKSSLAFDTIYAEGQRRYVETFSSYARQFLDRMDRPAVDRIDGMPPAIAIDQTNTVRTSRSTVGTMTEINDHLKLLFARLSYLVCNSCHKPVDRDSAQSIFDKLIKNHSGSTVCIVFTIQKPENFSIDEIKTMLEAQGYTRYLNESDKHVDVIQDITIVNENNRDRIIEDLEASLLHGKGLVSIYKCKNNAKNSGISDWHSIVDKRNIFRFSEGLHCPDCDIHFREPIPGTFSFNSPIGACDECRGFGRVIGVDYDLVIPDQSKALAEGAVRPWQTPSFNECQVDMMRFAKKDGIPVDVSWSKLSEKYRKWVIDGVGDWDDGKWYGIKRFFDWLESKSYKMHIRVLLSKYRGYYLCTKCNGSRLKADALNWRIGTDKGYSIHDVMLLPVSKLVALFNADTIITRNDEASELVLKEIRARLKYLDEVGLGYLTLDRQSRTLSGGEVQRINLTTALGTSLVNTLFVLDEPSIGLHSRDIGRLIGVLNKLRNAGNTLIIVEHDPEVIRAADYVIDMGPGPGELGGNIVFYGLLEQLYKSKESITAPFLCGKKSVVSHVQTIPVKKVASIVLKGAREHNLKDIDVSFPLNRMVCVTGVSGSGKSTLINDVLYNGLLKLKGKTAEEIPLCKEIKGHEYCDDIVMVDQSPIGKTTRSNPASYVGAFDAIRKIFADHPLSIERGYTAGTFSFNSGNGRCPYCGGNGFEHVEMQFLSDVYLRCHECNGKRFRNEILEIHISDSSNGSHKSISDILELTVAEAVEFFKNYKAVLTMLTPLIDIGLSYLKLGQPLPTLSGGEAQRLKLAGYIADKKVSKSKNILFLFDEPTTGLHFADIQILMNAFKTLINEGHSIIVIEHNLDVISGADWIIDLGPEGGEQGGEVLFCGTPQDLIQCRKSHTAKALDQYKSSFGKQETTVNVKAAAYAPVESMNQISIHNAKEHNLKNVNLVLPRDAFTVITGVSGSGKSTIAFDILFAEGQRRYLESLNAYARQFVQPSSKADVDSVTGVPPTVAIEQRTSRGGRKSTVATVTEIYHFLRLLYVKLGVQHCPECNIAIESLTVDTVCAEIIKSFSGKNVDIYAPLVVNRKGIYNDLAKWADGKSFSHLRVDNELLPTSPWPKIDRYKEHTIELPVCRISVEKDNEAAVRKNILTALDFGKGTVIVETAAKSNKKSRMFSTSRTCPSCSKSFEEPDPRLFSYNSKHGWCPECFGTGLEISGFDEEQSGEEIWWNEWYDGTSRVCRACNGKRLKPEALAVKINKMSISDFCAYSVTLMRKAITAFKWTGREEIIARDIIKELESRLEFLSFVGLDYLTLDRSAPTLSGGEAQRIRLASQLGSNLRGVCYILDEPTIGLHSRDNARLIDTLKLLKSKGNTVVVVEHDEDTIRSADYIVDVGPGGGKRGGTIIAEGTLKQIMANRNSITGQYLKHPLEHLRTKRSVRDSGWLEIKNATLHNLKSLNCRIPLGAFVCITGVSGSGKSTLIRDILFTNTSRLIANEKGPFYGCEKITGWEPLKRILEVDQKPIGKTPRSCPSTYIGFWDDIRKIFAKTSEAAMRGYDASRFSFNVDKGRCPACEGQGMKKIEMSFLPDVSVVCEECNGKRFTKDTLEIQFKSKTIADVLSMSVDEGVEFFAAHPKIHRALVMLQDVGLGYLTLGQQSPTLSGGEAQRIKLVTELDKSVELVSARKTKKTDNKNSTLYILDEPTVGLHTADIDKLLTVLHKLVDKGNSVVIIEHNLDVVADSDWVIDLGPEGGDNGGTIVAQGTPEKISQSKGSLTGKYLADITRRNH